MSYSRNLLSGRRKYLLGLILLSFISLSPQGLLKETYNISGAVKTPTRGWSYQEKPYYWS